MAYRPPELLDDLADLFADLRTWAGVIEKRPGVFYVRTRPFLHCHLLAGGRRRADVKGRTNRVQLDLPRPVTAMRRRDLFRELRTRYSEKADTNSAVRRGSPKHMLQRAGAPDARPGR